jgi:hypothetical protein
MQAETKRDFEKDFKNIEISTMTIIGKTNFSNIDIAYIFEKLPITTFVVLPKKRGRKRKEEVKDPNVGITEGSIITLKYKGEMRGVDVKNKRQNTQYFRNSLTVVMIIGGKKINFKVSTNGRFQITGCKQYDHAEKCIRYTWGYIEEIYSKEHIQRITNGAAPECIFNVVMTNIDFNVGFRINREMLDEHINTKTPYKSILETSFGYTGVNIKIPLVKKSFPRVKKIVYEEGKWNDNFITYEDYLKLLPSLEYKKEVEKEKYNTFLVFHSGNVIFSSRNHHYMLDTYVEFMNIIHSKRDTIIEKIE